MNAASRFALLLERRRLPRVASALLALAAVVGLTGLVTPGAGSGGRSAKAVKVATDLEAALAPASRSSQPWVRHVDGVTQVQVVIVGAGSDDELTQLRADVLRGGGSVHARHPAVRAITAQVPASMIETLARRDDVTSISPNRSTRRTASTLASITGALASDVRTARTGTGYGGLDGSGIGIAVLDSGVMKSHEDLLNGSGVARVKRNVSVLNASLAHWTTGVDGSASRQPGSAARTTYETAIRNDRDAGHDAVGHGSHVAAAAAGRARYAGAGAAGHTGVAPNADVYDVKVLDDSGSGTLSDALEGIQWVIYHAREYNIRVLNLSLATSSTETWQTDPLCIAVRSASAAGISVVAAAGNDGQDSLGNEVYGAVSAPGNDPTVITVGAVSVNGGIL